MTLCAYCKKKKGVQACASCGEVAYCSHECQNKNHHVHEMHCKRYWSELCEPNTYSISRLHVDICLNSSERSYDVAKLNWVKSKCPYASPKYRCVACLGRMDDYTCEPTLRRVAHLLGHVPSGGVMIQTHNRSPLCIRDANMRPTRLPIPSMYKLPVQNFHTECLLYYVYCIRTCAIPLTVEPLGRSFSQETERLQNVYVPITIKSLDPQLQECFKSMCAYPCPDITSIRFFDPFLSCMQTLAAQQHAFQQDPCDHVDFVVNFHHWFITAEVGEAHADNIYAAFHPSSSNTIRVTSTTKQACKKNQMKLYVKCESVLPTNYSKMQIVIYCGRMQMLSLNPDAPTTTHLSPNLSECVRLCKFMLTWKDQVSLKRGYIYESQIDKPYEIYVTFQMLQNGAYACTGIMIMFDCSWLSRILLTQ